MDFLERVRTAPAILTEGAIVTRLVYEFGLSVPDSASFVQLFQDDGRRALTAVYKSYMAIAAQYDIPMQVGTATWRAHPDGLVKQGFTAPDDLKRVNEEAVVFLQDLRRSLQLEGIVYIAGVIGPRVDGYDAAGAPSADDAHAYHAAQAEVLAASGVDVLYAPTFASTGELVGLSRACAATTLPYVLAPVINAAGYLPDGVSLVDAVARIDASVTRPPLHFQVGCVHPAHYLDASTHPTWPGSARVLGLQANASALPPEELEKISHVAGDDPEAFAEHMTTLYRRGARILGGCCGTSEAHLRALARRLAAETV
ncbi:homocysteine S-methyltransferase family protein [Paraburkholderia flava]|uniref:homocysteine S-methyltransferase family protein n=1 Tax=Paraburkholderia flava TaxID=2547393 RepID=UPI00105BC78C|nr:homocysteine S-methyltransferase family protein [Paraburkholderia flava]